MPSSMSPLKKFPNSGQLFLLTSKKRQILPKISPVPMLMGRGVRGGAKFIFLNRAYLSNGFEFLDAVFTIVFVMILCIRMFLCKSDTIYFIRLKLAPKSLKISKIAIFGAFLGTLRNFRKDGCTKLRLSRERMQIFRCGLHHRLLREFFNRTM